MRLEILNRLIETRLEAFTKTSSNYFAATSRNVAAPVRHRSRSRPSSAVFLACFLVFIFVFDGLKQRGSIRSTWLSLPSVRADSAISEANNLSSDNLKTVENEEAIKQDGHRHHHGHHHHHHHHDAKSGRTDSEYSKDINEPTPSASAKSDKHTILPDKCHIIPDKNQLIFASFGGSQSTQSSNASSVRQSRNLHLPVNNQHFKHHQQQKKQLSQPAVKRVNENFQIHTHYHDSFSKLNKDVLALYKQSLIPEAVSYWENSLKVKYPYFPIYLGRLCATSQVYYSEHSKTVSCENNCASQTKCGDYITIPEEHLDICRYCKNGLDCREKGVRSPGINADFILYISAINTEHCNISNTVAFASYCQLESKYNRPVAGYVNICPQSVSSKQSDIHSALATLKHEILHALGFSAGLYAFFLDANGNPLTERDSRTGKPPFNPKTNMYEASERVIKTVVRKKWKISDGYIDRNVTMIVTPRVVDEARMHFDCPVLEGAELEDQGEIGTKLTHWEKRVFENEAMTGTYTQNSVFSRLTFAFLEDTGWYTVNYSMAEDLVWGKGLGCDFAMKSCKHWIDEKRKKNQSIRPFCNNIPNTPAMSSKYECTANRDAVLLCNLMKYHQALPMNYRNFDSSHHHLSHVIKHDTDSISTHLGGSVVLADYCPFMQQVSWSINNDTIRDSKCSFEENKPEKSKNYVLEEYGKHSKCFLHNRTWQIYSDRCQSRITVSKTIGCYNYHCDPNQGLLVKVGDQTLRCLYEDQVIEFTINSNSQDKNFAVYFGNIVCPSCEEICGDEIKCPTCEHLTEIEKRSNKIDNEQVLFDDVYPSYIKKRDLQSVLLYDKYAEYKSLYKHSKKVEYGSNSAKHDEYLQNQHDYCLKKLSTFSSSFLSSSATSEILKGSPRFLINLNTFLTFLIIYFISSLNI